MRQHQKLIRSRCPEYRNRRSFLADPVYRPDVFTAKNLARAKRIILTPEPDSSTDERWERETPWVAAKLEHLLTVAPEHSVLDFGCGIGRLSKALMQGTGCAVLGVDISSTMRAQAHLYVDTETLPRPRRAGSRALRVRAIELTTLLPSGCCNTATIPKRRLSACAMR